MPTRYTILTYIWIDAFNKLRSKTKILHDKPIDCLSEIPEWVYDGSSCGQAEGFKSDVIIKPQFYCRDPFRNGTSLLVMCDTYNADGSPHITNKRYECVNVEKCAESFEVLFGIEQEYFVYDVNTKLPCGWNCRSEPAKSSLISFSDTEQNRNKQHDGLHYCGVGGNIYIRHIIDEHLECCMTAGLHIRGTNLEVTQSQAEYQIGELNATAMGDELWISRYILERVCEKYNCYVNYHPKPFNSFNGSGAHTNFSTKQMRCDGGLVHIQDACDKLREKHAEHIAVYGDISTNKLRLTGHHETSSIDKFSFEVSDRGKSCRIPLHVANAGKGYLEDRRPPSDMCPYVVTARMIKTICL